MRKIRRPADSLLISHLLRNVEPMSNNSVVLNVDAATPEDVVGRCADLLQLNKTMRDSLFIRYRSLPSAVGDGFAVLHLDKTLRVNRRRNTVAFVRLNSPVMWGDFLVDCVVGVGAGDKDHVEILSGIGNILIDPDKRMVLKQSDSVDDIINTLMNKC